jgi:CheY-like chemotaxis protein
VRQRRKIEKTLCSCGMMIPNASRVPHEYGAYHRQAAQYHALKAAGASLKKIAERLGTSRNRIWQIERQLGSNKAYEFGLKLEGVSARTNNAAAKLRVLLAEDHDGTRRAIGLLLSSEFDVIGTVADGESLLYAALALRPDVIVSDIAMPLFTGPQVMNKLMALGHDIPLVLVSADVSEAHQLIGHGAKAIVSKLDMVSELALAVRSAASREIYISRVVRSDSRQWA